jgi:hypothetical protein
MRAIPYHPDVDVARKVVGCAQPIEPSRHDKPEPQSVVG